MTPGRKGQIGLFVGLFGGAFRFFDSVVRMWVMHARDASKNGPFFPPDWGGASFAWHPRAKSRVGGLRAKSLLVPIFKAPQELFCSQWVRGGLPGYVAPAFCVVVCCVVFRCVVLWFVVL